MKKSSIIIAVLLLAAALFIGAAAAEPTGNWSFNTCQMCKGLDGNNYSITGSILTLPVDFVGSETTGITRIEATATIKNSSGTDITDTLTYQYSTRCEADVSGQNEQKPWIYAIAGIYNTQVFTNGVFTINVVGLEKNDNPYTIKMDITYGRGNNPSVTETITLQFYVKDTLVYAVEDNTLPSVTENKWSYTNESKVSYIFKSGNVAGTYASDVIVPKIARYNGEFTIENYPFTIQLNSTTTSAIKVYKADESSPSASWTEAAASTVTIDETGKITLVLGEADAAAAYLKISFVGYTLGNVTAIDDGSSSMAILTDIDYILRDALKHPDYVNIDSERLIYGDINSDGKLSTADGVLFFNYWKTGTEA